MKHSRSPQLYLASASPRRRELLAQVGLQPLLLPQQVDESLLGGESAPDYVLRLAREKAAAALRDQAYLLPLPVLAADTSVVCDQQVLGKPASLAEARAMLTLLSGRKHQVLTAVALATRQETTAVLVSTDVHFRTLGEAEIVAYWASGEPRDKAGAYAVQGLGAMFVSRIEGSYSGVVGLPLFETLQLLAAFGVSSTDLLQGVAA
jgi:septum formation protein